jgi:hypothetical protein
MEDNDRRRRQQFLHLDSLNESDERHPMNPAAVSGCNTSEVGHDGRPRAWSRLLGFGRRFGRLRRRSGAERSVPGGSQGVRGGGCQYEFRGKRALVS